MPSDLYMKYQEEDGLDRMNLDLEIAMEISSQIAEQSNSAAGGGKDPSGMVARRKQRRNDRQHQNAEISDSELLSTLKGEGE